MFMPQEQELQISYSPTRKTHKRLNIRESILKKVSTVKFLGVTLDENLTFKDHVNKLTIVKYHKSVGVMKRVPLPVAGKRNGFIALFFGVFPSHLCFTCIGMIGTY